MSRRRTFGERAAAIAGAGILALAVSPYASAQTAAALGAPGQPFMTAQNVVPASLTVTKDSASVSDAAAPVPPLNTYQPATAAAPGAATPLGSNQSSLAPNPFPPGASMMAMPPAGLSAEVKAKIDELRQGTAAERRLYARAAAAFPSFCDDWQHKLRVREEDNLNSLSWQEKGGYETATYVGYSPIATCECKESAEGIPLGKVTYDQRQYYVAGRTVEDAKHSPPKVVGITHTLEIFSWDQNKWFY